MKKYDVRAHSSAEAPTIYAVLLEGATWPEWTPLDSVELEGGGAPDGPQGVGEVRVFRIGRSVTREPIVELTPNRHMGYVNSTETVMRDYRGDVYLTPSPSGGTDIRWCGTFKPRFFGTGWLLQRYLTGFMQRMADGLARYSEERDNAKGPSFDGGRG